MWVEVNFEDSSTKKFPKSNDTTVADLLQKIETKMHIKSDFDSFALYDSYVMDGYQYDHILGKTTNLPDLAPDHKLLFKKRQFFNENWSDQDLVHMEYIQIREDVLRNRYILEESQWLQLSAIDLRVTYGSPDVSKHVAGFLTKPKLLDRFIPRAFLSQKSADEWESVLLEEYQRIAFEPINNDFEGKVRYLTKLKEFCPDYYGSIFYEGSEVVEENVTKDGETKTVKKNYPSLLAVNLNGIFMFRKDGAPPVVDGDKGMSASKAIASIKNFFSKATSSAPKASGPSSPLDKYKHVLIRNNTFKVIIGWSVKSNEKQFCYSVPGDSSSVNVTYCFETPLCDEIPIVCQEIVNRIISQLGSDDADPNAAEADGGEKTGEEDDGSAPASSDGA